MAQKIMGMRPSRFYLLLALTAAVLACQAGVVYYTVFFDTQLDCYGLRWSGGKIIFQKYLVEAEGCAPLLKGDQLLDATAADGKVYKFDSLMHLQDAVRGMRYGEPYTIRIIRTSPGGGGDREMSLVANIKEPRQEAAAKRFGERTPLFLLAFLSLATAILIGFMRGEDDCAFTASLLFFCTTGISWGARPQIFPPVFREAGILLWITLFSFVTAVFMRFFLLYPTRSKLDEMFPWLKTAGLWFGGIFALWNFCWHYFQLVSYDLFESTLMRVRWLDIVQDIIYAALLLIGTVSLFGSASRAKTPDERRRSYILLAGSLCIVPWMLNFLLFTALPRWFVPPEWVFYIGSFCLIAFPLSFAYAIIMHRVFGIRVILRKGIQFALLSKGFLAIEGVALFFLFYFGAIPIMGQAVGGASQTALATGTFAATVFFLLGLRNVNRKVLPKIEKHFFRQSYDAKAVFTKLAHSVGRMASRPDELFKAVAGSILESLHPNQVAVFLRGSEILRLPSEDVSQKKLAKKLHAGQQDDFYCRWHTAKSAGGTVPASEENSAAAYLPAGSALAASLERSALQEIDALTVYPEKALCWAGDLSQFGSAQDIEFINRWNIRLIVPLVAGGGLIGFISLGEKLSEEPYSKEDKEMLLAVGEQIAHSLEYADMVRESQEQAVLRREIQIAKEVQEKLLPCESVKIEGLNYVGTCRPARYVGGDYFDFIKRGEKKLGLAIGDISGKGVYAALLMASLQATLRIHADIHGDDIERMGAEVNRHIFSSTDEGRFATLFYGLFDMGSRELSYINAGHNPPMLFRPGKGGTEVTKLTATGMLMGISPETKFGKVTVPLQRGDVLVVYSDGITEAISESEEFYGEERLKDLIRPIADRSPAIISEAVFSDLAIFTGERPQSDDITLIVLRVT